MLGGSVVGLAAAVTAAVGIGVATPTTSPEPAAAPAAAPTGIVRVGELEATVLAAMNAVRRDHGLATLKLSPRLSAAAAAHSRQMGEAGFFKHESADGSAFWKRVAKFYPSRGWGYWSVGENLLWASPEIDAAGAVKLWLESPEHRKNMLAPRWREVGLGALKVATAPGSFKGLDVTIVTADFGTRR